MDRPRWAGGTSTTLRPSIRICPPVTSSSPAIRRKSVVLPHPEGPTKTTKEPFSISRLASLMMLTGPNDLRTPWSVIWPMMSSPFADLFDGAERQPADELPLGEPSEDDDRGNGKRRRGRQFRPEKALGARIGRDKHRKRRRIRRRKVQGPERLVPRQYEVEKKRRGKAGNGHRRQHINKLAPDGRAIHPRRFQDVLGDFLEIGEQHPDDDRQIAEAQDQDQAAARIEHPEIPV